jgi:selenide,water dikinase
MGAKALFALNVVAFPKEQPIEVLHEILAGGAAKAREAGIPVLGGHSVQSPEPKYGMAVTGLVHPKKVLTNAGGRAGDVLILTKPLGTGIATTAIKRGMATPALAKRVTDQMATLNKAAGEVFASGRFAVHALTDVTGFGLLGHLGEVARGAGLKAVLYKWQVPVMEGIPELAEAGVVPGGTKTNLEHVAKFVKFRGALPAHVQYVLADAQTNGGLLAALPEKQAREALKALDRAGVQGWIVGELEKGKAGTIEVV